MSKVIPFPSASHPFRPPVKPSVSIAAPVSNGCVIVRVLSKIAAEQLGDTPASLPEITWVIRTALPSIARCGKAWASLPELHRELLDRHIAAGDPTARMFKKWIENRHIPEARPARLADPIVMSAAKDDAHDA